MWKVIYNVLIHLLLPFFIIFALTRRKIRKSLGERLLPRRLGSDVRDLFWIHAASVGEAVIAENIINYVTSLGRSERFLITTNTYYTRDLLRAKLGDRHLIYSLPFDIPFSLRRFMGRATFRALLIVETEIWPNMIWLAKKSDIPVVIVNGRISDNTVKQYQRFSFFMKHVFSGVDLVLAQSEEHRERYVSIGMNPARVKNTGNLKYYRNIKESAEGPAKIKAITFGSVKEKEVEIVAPVIKSLKRKFPDHLIFVAPRELHIVALLEEQFADSFDVMRFSVYRGLPDARPAIVIVDTVGDLLGIYGKSEVAFVGGSLAPYGGQNMLEPLFFGTPAVFGPYVENFREIASEVVKRGAGYMVATGEELLATMTGILTDDALKTKMGHEGMDIVLRQKQVMEDVVKAVMEVAWKNFRNS